MAISMLQETQEVTVEMYDAVSARLGIEADPPPGMIVHTATPMDGGGVRIFDVWESQEHLDRFREERLLPTIAAVMADQGLEAPGGPPESTIGELHDLVVAKTTV
jgi:hypothetical protein